MPLQPKPVYFDIPEGEKPDTMPVYNQLQADHIPKIRNKYTFGEKDYQASQNRGVSLTIPNETYTIRELLNKHTKGIMPDVTRQAVYVDEVSHDDIDLMKTQRLDITEKQEIQSRQITIIEELENQVKQAETKKQTEAKQKAEAKREQNGDSNVEK